MCFLFTNESQNATESFAIEITIFEKLQMERKAKRSDPKSFRLLQNNSLFKKSYFFFESLSDTAVHYLKVSTDPFSIEMERKEAKSEHYKQKPHA